ncbi:MAG: hypothetical protein L0387_43525 [Acidobacteria bacterium]|nr:hypothetical protein [Acidobacteriota bacterium]
MPAARRVLLLILALLLLLLFLAVPSVSLAQVPAPPSPLADAARQLAGKIAAALKPGEALALTVRNISSLNAADTAEVGRALEADLTARGFYFVTDRSSEPQALTAVGAAKPRIGIRLTVSENLEGILLIADVPGGDLALMQLVPSRLLAMGQSLHDRPMLSIQKQLIWEDHEPILDFAAVPALPERPPGVLVLKRDLIAFYEWSEGSWRLSGQDAIGHASSSSRDPRGNLSLRDPEYHIELPGVSCEGSLNDRSIFRCAPGSQPWREGDVYHPEVRGQLVKGRNYFEIRPPAERTANFFQGEYYSGVVLGNGNDLTWLVAQVDGQTLLYKKDQELIAAYNGWGSDLELVALDCGSRQAVLATSGGDWTTTDWVRAFDIDGAKAVPVSPSIEFPGPIVALWNNRVVARNLKTGRYEAYRITISCGS